VVSPGWSAAIVQVPDFTPVTIKPLMVHTSVVVELNTGGSPDVAVALTVPVLSTYTVGAVPNEMV